MSRTHDFILSETELFHLRRAHKICKSKTKSYRLNALVLLGAGWSYLEVSEVLLLDSKTLRNYVNKYRTGGIQALLEDNFNGYEGKLSDSELKVLEAHLEEITYRRAQDIVAFVESEFDVTYTISGMTELLHRLNFSYKKPRKVPGKADAEKQKEFLKNYQKIRENMKPEDNLLFLDGVHPQHNPLVMCGWIKKGQEKKLLTNTRYHRLNILGAVDIKTHGITTQISPQLNEEASLDFLDKLRKKYPAGRLYLVLDNAGYFTAPAVKKFAEMFGIDLIYLPPYSPNLNLIERVWLYFQKNVLYNVYYPTFENFTQACKRFFRYFKQHRKAMESLLVEEFEIISV